MYAAENIFRVQEINIVEYSLAAKLTNIQYSYIFNFIYLYIYIYMHNNYIFILCPIYIVIFYIIYYNINIYI